MRGGVKSVLPQDDDDAVFTGMSFTGDGVERERWLCTCRVRTVVNPATTDIEGIP